MVYLFIVGHGMQLNGVFDPGAIGLIKKGEYKYMVEDLIPAMKKYLPKGHDVVFFDKHKVSNHGDIVALARKYKATQVTELHYDSSSNPDARGGHVIVYEGFTPDKIDLAFRDAINNVVGARKSYNHKGHVGVSGRNNLFNVNQMANAGISYRLLELGFGSGKRDSDIMINKVDEYAKELVKAITGDVKEVDQVSKPKPPTTQKPTPPVSKPSTSQTTSIVTYLNSKGINSSYGNRAKLAAQHGIKNYMGTTAQNTALLNKLRSGSAPSKPTSKGDMKTPSIINYLKSIGQDSSFVNRAKLAAQHGIKNYTGTAAQNTALLKKLRG